MTAANAFEWHDGIIFSSDTALVREGEDTIFKVKTQKIFTFDEHLCGYCCVGVWNVMQYMNERLQPDEFDNVCRAVQKILPEAYRNVADRSVAEKAGLRPDLTVIIGGHSRKEQGWRLVTISTDDQPGHPAFSFMRRGAYINPPPLVNNKIANLHQLILYKSIDQFGMRNFTQRLLEAQRQGFGIHQTAFVGGNGILVTIKKSGVTVDRVVGWPDEPGQRLDDFAAAVRQEPPVEFASVPRAERRRFERDGRPVSIR